MGTQPLLEGDSQFHPREIRTGAAVDSHAEREVAVLQPVEHDAAGVRERFGVSVRGGEAEESAVAFAHRAAAVVDVLCDDAGHGHW